MIGGAQLSAILGPTNTGKTHLAVERMCAHASGMIGFPLRLLAREVYDRVVALKGAPQVALVTGEERIVPPGARYFLCTAESMVVDRAFAFIAIDEGQMGADPERGHVFTNAMLHLRGTAETMILGADTLRPLIRRLLPDARITARPRFSSLTYEEPRKLSRLPARTAIVAFTAGEVYALAEMLRRHKGGAAVIMGGLSPRTRNAQVALYQSGEVDYLVATDAIGMGLNMDIGHVAFASLAKFDGRRHRRLRAAEMAQIAGRAGRHQRDGSFSTVQLGHDTGHEPGPIFTPDEIAAIEGHDFPPLSSLVWRNHRLDHASVPRLISSLEALPSSPDLWRSEDAIDLQVLKRLAADPEIVRQAHGKPAVMRLWAVCGLPDYRRTGAEAHSQLVRRIFGHLSSGSGRLPESWIRAELDILDNVAGDIATLSDRIAAARTWTYAAHRHDWLRHADLWAERARHVETRLSDALHERLTQRFIDRRTSILLRDLRERHHDAHVEVDPDGKVVVAGAIIGRLAGFAFHPDPSARAGEKRLLLAAAERRLQGELQRRAQALIADADSSFALCGEGRMPPTISWLGERVAALNRGKGMLSPRIVPDRSLGSLPEPLRLAVRARLHRWAEAQKTRHLPALARLETLRPSLSPAARGLIVQLSENLGTLPRASVEPLLASLSRDDRRALAQAGVRLGVHHVFAADLLRPEPTRWRLALWAVATGIARLPPPLHPGQVRLTPDPAAPAGYYAIAGYWLLGPFALRVDMADRAARHIYQQRSASKAAGLTSEKSGEKSGEKSSEKPGASFRPDPALAASLGLSKGEFALLMAALGFRGRADDGFAFARSRPRRRDKDTQPTPASHPFAALGGLLGPGRTTSSTPERRSARGRKRQHET